MKKTILILFIALSACNSSQQNTSKQKKLIVDFLQQDAKGVKTDLKIKISKMDISDIHVSDSIAILKKQYEEKKATKIKRSKKAIREDQKSLNNRIKKINSEDKMNQVVDKMFEKREQKSLEKSKIQLKKAQNWRPDYLDRYKNAPGNKLLVKKAVTTFSFFNPKLQTRQEMTKIFIFTNDGEKILGMIHKGKLRRKK